MFSKPTMGRISLLLSAVVMADIGVAMVRAGGRADAVGYPAGGGNVYCDYGMDMTKKNLTGSADTASGSKLPSPEGEGFESDDE